MTTVNVLGVGVACVDLQEILDTVQAWAVQDEPRTILYVNAHCLNVASRDAPYRLLLNRASLVYSDGVSVVWAGKLLGGCRLHKITGADWIYNFCECAGGSGLRLYLLAGKPGIARQAREHLLQRWPGLAIVGACDGYFIEKSEAEVLQDLARTAPHVLFVGMGTPAQEKWIAARRGQISAPVCWTVGALFDYVAGVEPRAPAWMKALALEWLWRLLIDPRGKWRRYLIGNPLFIYRLLRQKLSGPGSN